MCTRPGPSSPAVSYRMKRTGRRDTRPELALRSELHRRGLRYRLDERPVASLRTRADIVFRLAQVAVFVDGCFWHACPAHGTTPKANADWWQEKLASNVARDRRTNRALADAGWAVVRVWSHEDPGEAADRLERIIQSRLR